MAIIGQYETVQELGRAVIDGAERRVYTARLAGIGEPEVRYDQLETPAHFVIKLFLPRGEGASTAALAPFQEQAALQRRLNNAAARHWAVVHDAGKHRDGIFLAIPYYARTAHQMVASAIDLDERELHAIISGVLAGLLELKHVLHRPHGNLKSANILIDGHSPLRSSDIALTDPASSDVAAHQGEATDLRAVGELIHELVLHRPAPADARRSIPPSERWENLGRHGDTWRAICVRLLNAAPGDQRLRLAHVATLMRTLQPGYARRRWRRIGLAAAFLLALGGGLFGVHRRYVLEWSELCAAFDNWADSVDHASGTDASALLDAVANDDYLRDHVLPAIKQMQHDGPLDPRHIAGLESAPYSDLKDNAPASLSGAWRAHQAWRVVNELHDSLAHWNAPDNLERQADEYAANHCPHLARYLHQLAGSLRLHDNDNLAQGLTEWPAAKAAIDRIDDCRAAAASQISALQAEEQRSAQRPRLEEIAGPVQVVLEGARTYDAAAPTLDALKSLAARMQESRSIGDKMIAALPLLDAIASDQKAFAARGWRGPAQALQNLISQWSPYDQRPESMTRLSSTRQLLSEIDHRWDRIEERRSLLLASGDRLLATYGTYVAQSLGPTVDSPDLPQLLQRLDTVNSDEPWGEAAVWVGGASWARIDSDLLALSPSHAALHLDRGTGAIASLAATDPDVRRWLEEVKQPRYLRNSQIPSTPVAVTPATGQTESPIAPHPGESHFLASALDASRKLGALAIDGPLARQLANAWELAYRKTAARNVELNDFIAECSQSTIPGDDVIQKEWQQRNSQFALAARHDPNAIDAGLRTTRFKLKNRLLRLSEQYKSLRNLDLPDSHAPGRPAWNIPLRTALDQLADAQRAASLRTIIELTRRDAALSDQEFSNELKEIEPRYNELRQHAASLMENLNEVHRLLQRGYSLDESPSADVPTPRVLLERCDSMGIFHDDAVQHAIEPLMRPISAAAQRTDRTELQSIAANDAIALGVRLTAWLKLSRLPTHPWPADSSELEYAKTLRASLAASAGLLGEPRGAQVGNEIGRESRRQWEQFIVSAERPRDVELALQWHNDFGVADPARLGPIPQFNWNLHDVRSYLAHAPESRLGDRQLRDLIANLWQSAEKLPVSVRERPEINTLLTGLSKWNPESAVADFTMLGPMSPEGIAGTGRRIAWRAQVTPDEKSVTYHGAFRDDPAREGFDLVFRRYELLPDAQAGPASHAEPVFYLCTDDVSLGEFSDVIGIAGRWNELRTRKLLWDFDPSRPDPRPGPRGWEWASAKPDASIVKSLTWLSSDWIPGGADHYPESLGREFNPSVLRPPAGLAPDAINPSRRQPMQWVSSDAASYFAGLLGTRLPTPREWKAAYASEGKDVHLDQANLRDHTWRIEFDHLQRLAIGGKIRPDAGMFVPAGETPSNEVWKSRDGRDMNDGILWFREIQPQPPTPDANGTHARDMVGNVANFVADASGKTYVIGASALSPPTRPIDQAFEVIPGLAEHGFADVGFRMAMTGPVRPMDLLFSSLPPPDWYLTAPPQPASAGKAQ